jgi:DNA-binding NtrC family response regulator
MTSKRTVLYVADSQPFHSAAVAELRAEGYDVVKTENLRQAIALLFLNRKIEAVVIQPCAGDTDFLRAARILKSIRMEIPIIAIAGPEWKPGFASACVGEDTRELLQVLRQSLGGWPSQALFA